MNRLTGIEARQFRIVPWLDALRHGEAAINCGAVLRGSRRCNISAMHGRSAHGLLAEVAGKQEQARSSAFIALETKKETTRAHESGCAPDNALSHSQPESRGHSRRG